MAYQRFITPRHIYYGPGVLESLSTVSGHRALIVTDSVVRDLGMVGRVEKILHTNNIETQVFDKVEPEPSKNTAWNAFSMAQDFKPDLFIGLGGGSSIDVGKTAWVLYEHPDLAKLSFLDFLREASRRELRKKAKYVAIPTTSGTGSEATAVAVITDYDVTPPYKAGFASQHVVPDVAIVDSELTVSMPPAITANTGFDALIHAVECYVLSRPSDMVDPLALWAANTAWEWLPKAVANGKDIQARNKMHLASLQAGLAFSNSGLGLVHGTAHQIGSTFHIPHGRANAFMLCPVFAFLYPTHRARLSSLATALGMAGKDEQTKVTNLLDGLDKLKETVGIPLAIKDSGLEEKHFQEQIEPLAVDYMNRPLGRVSGLAKLTPEERRARAIPLSVDEVKELFMHAWNGTRAELRR